MKGKEGILEIEKPLKIKALKEFSDYGISFQRGEIKILQNKFLESMVILEKRKFVEVLEK